MTKKFNSKLSLSIMRGISCKYIRRTKTKDLNINSDGFQQEILKEVYEV